MEKLLNFINGEYCEPINGKFIDNYEPATGKVYSLIPDSDANDVEKAVEAAVAEVDEQMTSLEAHGATRKGVEGK